MTIDDINAFYDKAIKHQQSHKCGGIPYQQGKLLLDLAKKYQPQRVLEIGIGTGYSAFCVFSGYSTSEITSIDKDPVHLRLAQENWQNLNTVSIKVLLGKVEDILPTLIDSYDLIFFDGYDPQIKLLPGFEKILTQNGILVTANLFLKDSTGGRVLRALKNDQKWQTEIIADTAISVKVNSSTALQLIISNLLTNEDYKH